MDWIRVEEDLPAHGDIVLICDEFNSFVSLGKYVEDGDEFYFYLMSIDKVEFDSQITHWTTLPELPKS